jgi:hypothetical protein
MPRSVYFICQKHKTILPNWFVVCRKPKRIIVVACHFEQKKKEEEVPDEGDGFLPKLQL